MQNTKRKEINNENQLGKSKNVKVVNAETSLDKNVAKQKQLSRKGTKNF